MKNEPSPKPPHNTAQMVEQETTGNKRLFTLTVTNNSAQVDEKIPEVNSLLTSTDNNYPHGYKPAIVHASFDPHRESIDPMRPLTDIPDPQPRLLHQIEALFATSNTNNNCAVSHEPSKWELIQSSELADYIEQQQLKNKLKFPHSFYHNTSLQPLLPSIEHMSLVDTSEIQQALHQVSSDKKILVRQGFVTRKRFASEQAKKSDTHGTTKKTKKKVPLWQSILQPMKKNSLVSLDADIMAISIVQHVLKQCRMRKTINYKLTVEDITDYVRSYVLAQTNLLPAKIEQLKHVPIYQGHVLLVAHILGWQTEKDDNGNWVFNVSSRSSLFARYPVLSDYAL